MKSATRNWGVKPVSGEGLRVAAAPPTLLEPGELLADKYRIESVIGMGGMGVVYAATNVQLDHRVAVKMLLASADAETSARFTREARTVAKLQNEHVARVIDLGDSPDHGPFMVLELLEGEDFADLLDRVGHLEIDVAVAYTLEACEAMAEAHSLGVVHRDLKPQNLFLALRVDGTEIVKVLDFGISKVALGPSEASITQATDVLGSPMYMSPEALRASRDVDARSDLWSLGITLYELIAGRTPFPEGSVAEVCASVLTTAPMPLCELCPDVPDGLSCAVMRCLEKAADDRFADVGELAAALVPFGGGAANESCERIARLLGQKHSERPRMLSSAPPLSDGAPRPLGSDPWKLLSAEEAAPTVAGFDAPRPSSPPGPRSSRNRGRRRSDRSAIPWRAGAAVAGFAVALAFGDVTLFSRAASAEGVASASLEPVVALLAAAATPPLESPEASPDAPALLAEALPIPSAAPRARSTSPRSELPAVAPRAPARRSPEATMSAFVDRK